MARSEREQPLFILVCLLKVFLFSLFYSRLSESPRVRPDTFTFTESDLIEDVRSELELNSFATECILFLQGTSLDWTLLVPGTVRD